MSKYASGRHAYGFCERCACRWPIGELKSETFRGNLKNNRVCSDCWDKENPQVFIGTFKIEDPQTLKRPAPDIGLDAANAFPPITVRVFGLNLDVTLGTVTVSTV